MIILIQNWEIPDGPTEDLSNGQQMSVLLRFGGDNNKSFFSLQKTFLLFPLFSASLYPSTKSIKRKKYSIKSPLVSAIILSEVLLEILPDEKEEKEITSFKVFFLFSCSVF